MQHRSALSGRHRTRRGGLPGRLRFRAHRRSESGAALVEAAIILPVLMLFLLAIMEFGLVYASGATATGASRSGARLAATNYAPAMASTTTRRAAADAIADAVSADSKSLTSAEPVGMVIYKVDPASAEGAPTGGWPGNNAGLTGGCTANCFRYTWTGSPKKMTYSSGDWAAPDACGLTVDSIGVYVVIKHTYLTKVLGDSTYVTGKTVMRLEPLPTDQCTGP
jgi:Flp pilus assembly protein TadG